MKELNDSDFVDGTSNGLVLVDFYAPWCGPCRMIAPMLEKLQGINVVKVNIDDSPVVTSKYKIEAIPCLVFLKDGVEMDRLVGYQTQTAIQQKIDTLSE